MEEGAGIAIIVIFSILILATIILLSLSLRIVNHAEVMIIERWGKYNRTLMPGIHFITPIIEQVRNINWRDLRKNQSYYTHEVNRIDLREHVFDFGKQHVITKDTVQIDIDALVYFRITDPRLAAFKIQNIPDAIEFVTQATLRNIIAGMTLDDTFSSRDMINSELLSRVQPDVERWGVSISRVEIFNITPPNDIKMAMERQIKAERDRRSEVLKADGDRESKITNSRGNAAQIVLNAEGQRASATLIAKGQAEARMLSSRAEAQSMQAVRKAVEKSNIRGVDYLAAVQYLNSLKQTTASQKPSKVVMIPTDAIDGISDLVKMNSVGL